MKLIPVAVIGLGMMVAGVALVTMRQATAQQSAADAQTPSPYGPPGAVYPNPAGQGYSINMWPARSRDQEMDRLRAEEARLEGTVAALVRDYAQSKGEEEQKKVKDKLSTALEKQFDLQQKRRGLEVARIEAELKKLRDLMQKRTDARKTIVEKRLDQLVREADGLGWTTPHVGPGPNFPFGGMGSQAGRP